ncbi:MAG: activase, partial [Clostridiales bacterium]|nr:activase [Clostridiales bacterium]
MNDISTKPLYLGLDIGSTTVKAVVLDPSTDTTLYSCYVRHRAKQSRTVRQVLEDIDKQLPQRTFRVAVCGSGGKDIATAIDASFIQEVVANAAALRARYDNVGTAIELGGQDAKIIFFRRDSQTGSLEVADMRMNGSCAGGTGAFIDEVASILNVPVEEFNALAAQGTTVYDVSGRCGVYAKTDIQPLLNQGISKADLALSTFHAIAKQTIGGLAQGLDITAPVAFEGGPLTFNPTLVDVFRQRLELKEGEALHPEHPELMIARGAALSLDDLCADSREVALPELVAKLLWYEGSEHAHASQAKPFFATEQERDDWKAAHALPAQTPIPLHKGQKVRAWLGIDSGSTTTKFVLLDDEENLLDSFYAPNAGEPLQV